MRIKSNTRGRTLPRSLMSPETTATAIAETARFGGDGSRMISADGEINANSRQELLSIVNDLSQRLSIGEFAGAIDEAATAETAATTNSELRRLRNEELAAAFADRTNQRFAEIGASISATISTRLNRQGFARRHLARADLPQGQIARVRQKVPNVDAIVSTGPTTVGIQVIRDKWIFPVEFYISTNLRIEEIELQQGSSDILDEKFFEGLEAIMVREDRQFIRLADQAVGLVNDVQYYSGGLTPAVLGALTYQVTRWNLPIANITLSQYAQTEFTTGAGFANFFDPVSRLMLLTTGVLGSWMGTELLTDGFRDPRLKVLNEGDIYVTTAPDHLGVYTDRGPVQSESRINTEDFPGKGWYQYELHSQAIVNARGIAKAVRV